MKEDEKIPATDQNEPVAGPNFLVGEETDDVKPTGVDDESTGMEGDDYLGKTNNRRRDEEE